MIDPISAFVKWLTGVFANWGLSPGWSTFIMAILGAGVIAVFVLVVDVFLVWVERKVVARFQDRLGPNRIGPFGLIQPFADVIKLLIKEDLVPKGADKIVFNLAPILALATVLALWAVIPMLPSLTGTDLNIELLYIVAIGAISTLGIIMAGWASNNKYALMGAFRMVAQMVSYEVPMVIVLLVPVIVSGSMGMNQIVEQQTVWNILLIPTAAFIFLTSALAELGRAPFDMVEAESEIVAGFHIEYSGMKFGLFYAGELLHAFTVGAIFSTIFLGGWRGPGTGLPGVGPLLGLVYLFLKAFFMYFVIMWIKYTFPRLRIDHMLNFNWKFLTPLALTLVVVVAILDKVLEMAQAPDAVYVLSMLAANIAVGLGALALAGKVGRKERKRVAEAAPIAVPPEQPAVPTNS